MQTFKYDLRLQATVIVKDEFLAAILEAARDPQITTPFLTKLLAEYEAEVIEKGEDHAADTIVAAVCTNAIRKQLQVGMQMFLIQAGHGARVSPVEVLQLDVLQPRADSKSRTITTSSGTEVQLIPVGQSEAALLLDSAPEAGAYQTTPPGH